MNAYTQHIIKDFYYKFENRTFEQNDAIHFLIIIREYCPEKSILKELGNFIAHIKKKDKGMTIKLFKDNAEILNQFICNFFNGEKDNQLRFKILGNNIVAEELKEIFKKVIPHDLIIEKNLEYSKEENFAIEQCDQSFKEFVFCIIMFLSSCKIELYFVYRDGNYTLEVNKPDKKEINQIKFRTLLNEEFIVKPKEYEIKIQYGGVIKAYIEFKNENYLGLEITSPMTIMGLRNTRQNFNQQNELRDCYAKRFECGTLGAVNYDSMHIPLKEIVNSESYFPCVRIINREKK